MDFPKKGYKNKKYLKNILRDIKIKTFEKYKILGTFCEMKGEIRNLLLTTELHGSLTRTNGNRLCQLIHIVHYFTFTK